MKKNIWFKKKTHGRGWTPCSWQGWLTTFSYITVLVVAPKIYPEYMAPREATYWIYLAILTMGLFIICYWKGEK